MVATGSALLDPVLVLNKGWMPIDACTVRDALTDVAAEKARIICHDESLPNSLYVPHTFGEWITLPVADGERSIATVNSRIKVPEVVVENEFNRIPTRTVVYNRRNLWKRDRYRCQYCGRRPPNDEITVDHVVPRAIWNRQNHTKSVSCFENCVLACVGCNKKKDNRTPEQAGMRLRRTLRLKDGTKKVEFYDRPKSPLWSPLYAVRRYAELPQSWSKFVSDLVSELYWTVELED